MAVEPFLAIGFAVAKLALRAADEGGVAAAVGDAWSGLEAAIGLRKDSARAAEKRVAEAIAVRVRQSVNVELTPANAQQVERVSQTIAARLRNLSADDEALLTAHEKPDGFLTYVWDHGATRERDSEDKAWRGLYEAVLPGATQEFVRVVRHFPGLVDAAVLKTRGDTAAIRSKIAPEPPSGQVLWRPELTGREVARPGILDELRGQLTATASPAPVVGVSGMTALRGTGGFGKSTVARMLVHEAAVLNAYPGGIVWVQFSEQAINDADITGRVAEATFRFEGVSPQAPTPSVAGELLNRALRARGRVLLVIDDVWTQGQLEPFKKLGSGVTLLVTTRNARLLPAGVEPVLVDQMSPDEAASLLLNGLPTDVHAALNRQPSNRALVNDLLRVTGRWALLLGLIGASIRDRRPTTVAQAEPLLRGMLDRLRAGGVADLDPTDPQHRWETVTTTLEVSLDRLTVPDARRRDLFASLAVFPEDHRIPLTVLHRYWHSATGWHLEKTRDFCRDLDRLSLLSGSALDSHGEDDWIQIHDVVRDYLVRGHAPQDLERRHAALVDAHRCLVDAAHNSAPGEPPHEQSSDCATAWWSMPATEGYWWLWLGHHLHRAGPEGRSELGSLLREARYLCAALETIGASTVELDLEASAQGQLVAADLALLARVVRQDAPTLAPIGHAGWIAATLAGRLPADARPEPLSQALVDDCPRPTLRSVLPELPDLPHPALHRTLTGHTDWVSAVAFSPDGTLLATTSNDLTARLWDPHTGAHQHTITGHTHWVRAVAFSPDGTLLATTSNDLTARLWDPHTGAHQHTLTGHTGPVSAVAFSPDGTLLATTSDDETARLWDPRTGAHQHTLTGHTGPVSAVAFSPDGTLLATTSWVGTARMWDPHTGQCMFALRTATPLSGVVVTFGDRVAVIGGSDLFLFELLRDQEADR